MLRQQSSNKIAQNAKHISFSEDLPILFDTLNRKRVAALKITSGNSRKNALFSDKNCTEVISGTKKRIELHSIPLLNTDRKQLLLENCYKVLRLLAEHCRNIYYDVCA